VPKVVLHLSGAAETAALHTVGSRVPRDRVFTVVAKNLSKENKYVKSVTLNGKPLDAPILRHADIMRGGELVFEMRATP
jgi:putative alpha-1,2-mannosidase